MNLDEAKEYATKLFNNTWVKWLHEKTVPAETNAEKVSNILLGALTFHCAICLNLNGCCFIKDKCPTFPLHPNCHCNIIDITPPTIKADCPIEKFTKYIFSNGNSKKQLFESWGYSIINSRELQEEFNKQAKSAYLAGEYELGKLDKYGQRVSIKIKLKRLDKNEYVTFLTGWMVYPNGKIVLNTPYGGK